VERSSILGHRWWKPEEIESSDEMIYPENLAELVRRHQGRPTG